MLRNLGRGPRALQVTYALDHVECLFKTARQAKVVHPHGSRPSRLM